MQYNTTQYFKYNTTQCNTLQCNINYNTITSSTIRITVQHTAANITETVYKARYGLQCTPPAGAARRVRY